MHLFYGGIDPCCESAKKLIRRNIECSLHGEDFTPDKTADNEQTTTSSKYELSAQLYQLQPSKQGYNRQKNNYAFY